MNSFIIPDLGNEITYDDIKKNQLRITQKFMVFFPYENIHNSIFARGYS